MQGSTYTPQSTAQQALAWLGGWFTRSTAQPPRRDQDASTTETAPPSSHQPTSRPVQVWDERLNTYRVVDLNNPDDPLWLMAYHVHAIGKGAQTGPAF